ncbi:MAG: YtxH domain-containing protein [Bryobacterales bacterium]|nr:YtxH domain-containing protein [Bryobacterales bacterium]
MKEHGYSMFLLGLGVGIGVGMLCAPKTGTETRDMIKAKADEGKEYLRHQRERLRQQGERLRSSASEWYEKGRDIIDRQRSNLNEAVEAGKQAYEEKVHASPGAPSWQG